MSQKVMGIVGMAKHRQRERESWFLVMSEFTLELDPPEPHTHIKAEHF